MSLSVEAKIELKKEEVKNVPVVELEEEIIKKKIELLEEMVDGETFVEIDKQVMSFHNKYEALRKAALQTNSKEVYKIDEWDLTQEEKDYIFVQKIMNKIFEGRINEVSLEEYERLCSIRAEVIDAQKQGEDTEIKSEMRRLLSSSRMDMIQKYLDKVYKTKTDATINNGKRIEEK